MSTDGMPDPVDHTADPSADLLTRWQAKGDLDALDALIALEIARLKARIRARARHAADPASSASDIAQEAVLRLLKLEERPRFETPQALRAYLWTTAWRLLADRLRSAGSSVIQLDPTQSGVIGSELATTGGIGSVEARDLSVALGLAVNLLDPEEQRILALVHFQGHGIDGAARELGVSRDAANMRCVRARRSLAKKLLRWTEVIG